MLALTRKPNETIEILGGKIIVTVLRTGDGKVMLGFEAHRDIDIYRGEVADAIRREFKDERQQEASTTEVATSDV